MILSAGLGTRLKPWTDSHPKALAMVNGKPLLQRNIEYLQQFGITEVIINVHHFADQITRAVENNQGWGSRITISDETEAVLETGGGLLKASWFFDTGDFVLMNSDVLTNMDLGAMIRFHQRHSPLATLAVTGRQTSRYFLFDEDDNLCGWRNIKTGEEIITRPTENVHAKAFSGIHVINPDLFTQINLKGKFSMVDLYLQVSKTKALKGFDHSASSFIDVGKPESIVKAEGMFE
jgi:NDP-sugar pyrophosphorylase family protein